MFSIWGNQNNEAYMLPMVKLTPTLPDSQNYMLGWNTVSQGLDYFPVAYNPTTGSLSIVANSAVPVALANAPLSITGSVNGFLQLAIRNALAGASASSDVVAGSDTSTDTTNFVDMGINSSVFADATWTINGANDSYLYAMSGVLSIGTASAKELNFFTGGTLLANKRLAIDTLGNFLTNGMAAATSAQKALHLANAVIPTANPVGGGVLYVEAGALKYRGSGGTITTVGVA